MRGFNADLGIPFSWRQCRHLVQELVNTCKDVLATPRFVGHLAEHLQHKDPLEEKGEEKRSLYLRIRRRQTIGRL